MQSMRSRSFYMLLLSLCMVLVIPMSMLFLAFNSTVSTMVRSDYLSLNSQLIHTISDRVDTYLTARMNFAFSLSQSRAVRKLAAQVESSREDATETFRELESSLKSLQIDSAVFRWPRFIFHSAARFVPRRERDGTKAVFLMASRALTA